MRLNYYSCYGAFVMDDDVIARVVAAHTVDNAGVIDDNTAEDVLEDVHDNTPGFELRSVFFGRAIPIPEANASGLGHENNYADDTMVYLEPKNKISMFDKAYPSFDDLVDEYIERLRDEFGITLGTRREYEVRICNIVGFSD